MQAFGAELIITILLTPQRHFKECLSEDGCLNCWDLSFLTPIGFPKACLSRPNAPNN